jgi:hypothetical protein
VRGGQVDQMRVGRLAVSHQNRSTRSPGCRGRRHREKHPARVKVAVADYDLREATDYLARLTAVQHDLEAVFLAKHRSELDAMRAAAD